MSVEGGRRRIRAPLTAAENRARIERNFRRIVRLEEQVRTLRRDVDRALESSQHSAAGRELQRQLEDMARRLRLVERHLHALLTWAQGGHRE